MWPLPQIKNDRIHLVLHAERAVCVRFVWDGLCMRMQDYRVYHIPIGNARLLTNITGLQAALVDFITTFKLHGSYLSIVLGPDLLQERVIRHSKSDATPDEIVPERDAHTLYHMQHIGPHEDTFLFYLYAVSQPFKLQLELLHHRLPVHMHCVVSPLQAQIEVYKRIAAPAFSQARLAQEIDVEKVYIPSVFSPEVLRRSIKIDLNIVYNAQDVVSAWGSFLGAQ